MKASTQIKEIIKKYEGFRADPYYCVGGYCTVGYGHVLPKGTKKSVTKEEADELFEKDLAKTESAVSRLVVQRLTQNQFDALVSFTFNLGPGTLQRSTLRRKINRGEMQDAPREFLKYVYASGKKWPGLQRRRATEASLFSITDRNS